VDLGQVKLKTKLPSVYKRHFRPGKICIKLHHQRNMGVRKELKVQSVQNKMNEHRQNEVGRVNSGKCNYTEMYNTCISHSIVDKGR